MRLTTMSSSIIHQVMENQINVIYEPDNSLFDHILCGAFVYSYAVFGLNYIVAFVLCLISND